MTPTHITPLSDLERDALGELSNIAMARAANSLRQMTDVGWCLYVPHVDIVSKEVATQLIGKSNNPTLVAIRQDFTGAFSGRALLIFPEASSLELVRIVVGRQLPWRISSTSKIRAFGRNRKHHLEQLGCDDRKSAEKRP